MPWLERGRRWFAGRSSHRLSAALAVLICGFGLAAAYLSLLVLNYGDTLRSASPYNFAWAASQAVGEVSRLEQRILASALPGSAIGSDEVQLRIDIVRNRIGVLGDGQASAFIERYPQHGKTIDRLEAALDRVTVLLASQAPASEKAITALSVLGAVDHELTAFASAANQFGGEQVDAGQDRLLFLHWLFTALAMGLAVCGILFITLLVVQNRTIRQAHRRLETMTSELRVAAAQAEEASQAKTRFLATMSHELRTPLNAIIGFSELIQDDVQPRTRAAARPKNPVVTLQEHTQYAGYILASAKHMLSLVIDILSFAQMETGHINLRFEPVDVEKAIRAAIAMMLGTPSGQGRSIAMERRTVWPVLQVDEQALRQMLLNLLSNAVKFSASETPILVDVGVTPDGGLVIAVQDQGIGMTAEQVEKAAQPFYQADGSSARRFQGTGLGLSIAKTLMEAHGGKLVIESALGQGTRASMHFPAERVGGSTPSLHAAP